MRNTAAGGVGEVDQALHYFSDPYTAGIRQNLIGIYLQDDIQVSPNLNLNLGLRYEFITLPTEVNDRVGAIFSGSQREPTIGGSYFSRNPSLKNFSPRVGFAWDPTGSGKYSVRGGFGLFHDQLLPYLYTLVPGRSKPFAIQSDYRERNGDTIIFPTQLRDSQITDRALQAPNIAAILATTNQPYLMSFNLTLQAEIFPGTAVEATYSGSKGVHLARITNHNLPVGVIQADGRRFFPGCSGRGCTPPPESRPHNPNFGTIQGRNWDGDSSYHGLKLGLKKRFSAGFAYQMSYTFQKFLDNGSNYTGSPGDFVTGNTQGSHFLDAGMDKGPSAWNTPQTFSFNGSLDLPFGPGRRFGSGATGVWGKVIEGWQINGLARLADGPAVEINVTGRRFTCSVCDSRPDLIPGMDNSPNSGDPNAWFGDPTENFTQPETGYFGNVGRNTAVGPGLATLDFSILKNFSMGETARFQFRAEFFNIMNRANFHPPERTRNAFSSGRANSASFGRVLETATTSRQIQLAMRIDF